MYTWLLTRFYRYTWVLPEVYSLLVISNRILHLTRDFYLESTAFPWLVLGFYGLHVGSARISTAYTRILPGLYSLHVGSTWILQLTRGFYLDSTVYTLLLPWFYSLHVGSKWILQLTYTWLLPGLYILHVAFTWILQLTRGFYSTWMSSHGALSAIPFCIRISLAHGILRHIGSLSSSGFISSWPV